MPGCTNKFWALREVPADAVADLDNLAVIHNVEAYNGHNTDKHHFEVSDTVAVLGVWDHNISNYGSLYDTKMIDRPGVKFKEPTASSTTKGSALLFFSGLFHL